ncbi:MAG: peptidylprolyl isomerase [Ignavibacteria bacterium GWA2_55_11]|nr:MAG: peptidylprolyl isomerase [Ignavibacteria bacterium GWA2_55_11]OGU43620.1 MAG: peptidylprolyl isomerase [Ignavibacteria bacterium GWC2_56_12]OGU61946.1 MAG: peptidylprolyl isomerase [Ignavibacteria bacterium RIFCSPHIGHO2_02_FULL_56_12]OGU68953.1 MAG: peptidylprolyl isomerase [Ignavibacteria bacterium RIFCSPLOWO2_02_FULL_55_14]OGU72757.1 MAG: peptidylprolyl isomerase [Ignavibacteria bacterium RIFCSPLOWO2_12_FULL_56_21]
MHTSKGEITVELLPEDAPFTVLSFLRLARKKFYDGLTFHRVVPNFVVQGGDPRGDSWGGPGYSIRSEVSLVGYERGSVGMASAGKDTEGSQFFITHAPTLHLDGRYTIFGKVVRGMDVVDRLQIGDRILSVTLQRDRAR